MALTSSSSFFCSNGITSGPRSLHTTTFSFFPSLAILDAIGEVFRFTCCAIAASRVVAVAEALGMVVEENKGEGAGAIYLSHLD